MRQRIRLRTALLGGLCLAAGLATTAARADDLTVALSAPPSSVDPHFHEVTPNNMLARHIYSALVSTDPKLQIQPGLATSWTLLDDRTWKFTLRQGVKFHSGAPFTANDVVYSLCDGLHSRGSTASFENVPKGLESVEVPDDHTVILRTKEPNPVLLPQLSGFAILSATTAGAGKVAFGAADQCHLTVHPTVADFDSGKMSDGTGPYRLEKYVPGDTIVLRGNPDYFGRKPRWDRVTMKVVSASGPRLAGLMAGDYALIEDPAATDLPTLKRHGGLAWSITPSARIMFLQPDIGRAQSPGVSDAGGKNPLQDPRVREAISLAIDRQAIVARIMDGAAQVADQYLPAGLFGALDHPPPRPYDPARARKLLAEAGYPNGFTLTLSATNNRYINDAQVAQAVAQFLSRIGIRTRVDAMPLTLFFPRRAKHDFSLSLGGWGSSTGEASSLLRFFVVSPHKELGIGGSNYGFYASAAFDAPFLKAIGDMNDDSRRAELQQATSVALHDNALIPLYWETSIWAYKDKYAYTGRMDQITDVDNLVPKAH